MLAYGFYTISALRCRLSEINRARSPLRPPHAMTPPRLSAISCALTIAVLVSVAPRPAAAQTTIDRWLVLGPTPVLQPFGSAASDSSVLGNWRLRVDGSWPREGGTVPAPSGAALRWSRGDGSAASATMVYAAAYISSERWQRLTLESELAADEARRVWVDGARVTGTSVTLTRGKHMVLVQRAARGSAALGALSLRFNPAESGAVLVASLDPLHAPTWRELHSVRSVNTIATNPTGTRVAVVLRARDASADRTDTWLEVREVTGGKLLNEWRNGAPASPRWSPDGSRLALAVASDKPGSVGRDVMIWNAATNSSARVLRSESVASIVGWSPDGARIYYLGVERASRDSAAKPGAMTRLTEVWQRFGDSPDKMHLFAVNVAEGTRTTVVGDSAVGLAGASLSPDGKTIVFSRSVNHGEGPPWLRAELWTLDVATLATKRLLNLTNQAFSAPTTFAWAPDSRAIAFCGSAKEVQARADSTFSVYENELYATSIERPALVHLSEGYVPSVGAGLGCSQLVWNAKDGRIYAPVDAGARSMIARTVRAVTSAVDRTTLETMALPAETMSAFDIAGDAILAAVEGPTTPPSIQRIDLATGRASIVSSPNAGALESLAMPTWSAWSFRNSRGENIESWYWLPPAFDSTAKHPMIVHYYGGTLPMKKEFEERLLWFASNGYVVLMMNPAGAPGYGQKFSDYHANDWGYPAASDIIEGTQQFTATHAYVDASRVGNFGHSYGGFMTMHLLTRTKIFRTGISLAGISNIADYWGAGASGYSYTDGTCPGCYPWNRKDVYVDRSPLFQADNITTPLLLIHGDGDTNVVPTESEQMFTALRMLGREVELIRVAGENHGINSRPAVEEGRDGAMLDWFDKYLRDRPEAWTARWAR